MKITLNAPAKINWFLDIVDKRDDGYHNIVTAMQFVNLFDHLTFEKAEKIEVICSLNIPVAENLVYKAAVLIKKYSSYNGGARITLKKEIPHSAGLGGGSSDAAYTLMGLNRLWVLGLNTEKLTGLASETGSDVPFFIRGPFSLAEGRGERVNDLNIKSNVAMLLVKPEISISSSWAYNSYRTELTKKHIDIKLFCQALENKDFILLKRLIFNDLEKPVFMKYHIVREIKEMLSKNGAVISSMSGSGPTVFGVFNSVEEAVEASKKTGNNWCRVVRTLNPDDKWQAEDEK